MKPYNIDDLQSDLEHLGHLIDTAADTIMQCDFGPADARVPHMDRLNALIWIARDMTAALNQCVDEHYKEIATSRCPSKAEGGVE